MAMLTNKDHDLLNYMEQVWLTDGYLPTEEKCVQVGVTTKSHYKKCMESTDFRHALIARGISIGSNEHGVLTEEQLVVANAMLDLRDNRSQSKKLKELNVPTQKWEAWLRDPAFQSYLRTRAENLLGDNSHEAHLALVDRVRSGDVSAIKYYNEITGRYVPGLKDTVDAQAIIMRILEIIQMRVKDTELQALIADDLLALARANTNSAAVGSSILGTPKAIVPGVIV